MATKLNTESMNLHQKLFEIAKMCGVLRKEKAAYGYKYVEENAIQAALTAGLQKYGVILLHNIVPGTFSLTPHSYEKFDKTTKANKTVTEFIVTAETTYTWINADNPDDKIEGTYAMVGMQEDPSMAFGSAETYCNRYYLLKMLQIATTEDDPDNWRAKQREAADIEAKEAERQLNAKIKEVVDAGATLMKSGFDKTTVMSIVASFNDGNGNPSSIGSIEVCEQIIEAFNNAKEEKRG